MRHAEVDKMRNARCSRRFHSFETGLEIYFEELAGFRRTRVGNADELDKRVCVSDQVCVGSGVERIPKRDAAAFR